MSDAKAEKKRLEAEKKAEKERVEAEKKAEKARLEAEKKAEKERVEAEKKAEKKRQEDEKKRIEAEKKAEKERIEAEKKAAKEAAKLAKKGGAPASPALSKSTKASAPSESAVPQSSEPAQSSVQETSDSVFSTSPILTAPDPSLSVPWSDSAASASDVIPVTTEASPTTADAITRDDRLNPEHPDYVPPIPSRSTKISRNPSIQAPEIPTITVYQDPYSYTDNTAAFQYAEMYDAPIPLSASRENLVYVENEEQGVGNMRSDDAGATSEYLVRCVQTLREQMQELYDNGTNSGYQRAYRALATVGTEQSAEASSREANKLKNRYNNIRAYDSTRVVLPIINDDPDTDYVNANYISGYKNPKAYIASQGPVPNSFISFWRMVWLEKIEIIVMVTHEMEGGKLKCHRYWPDPTSNPPVSTQQFGSIFVTYVSTEQHSFYAIRKFEVRFGNETRQITHFYYQAWPDHGVPSTSDELLTFRCVVNQCPRQYDSPILIHCSAGVGRTGTYIAIDQLVEQCLDMAGMPDVDACVRTMRMCRNYMVQTEVQYIFIYRVVIDALSELLEGESAKARRIAAAEEAEREHQRYLQEQAAAAAAAMRQEKEKEEKAMLQAKKEYLARTTTSAANAAQLVEGNTIKDRIKRLKESETERFLNYKKSLEEWSERNKLEAEVYDLTSGLTPMQSRLEALRQKGLLA